MATLLSAETLAAMNIDPAIDVLNSISRVMIDIVPPTQMQAANRLGACWQLTRMPAI